MQTIGRKNRLVVVMGVSGCGKSTLSKQIAASLKYQLLEADDFHSQQAKQHMTKGLPLNDQMREPWISALCDQIAHLQRLEKDVVMAFSGLRRAHRERIRSVGFDRLFIHLHGEYQEIANRINRREGHFMKTALLRSQFDALQMPVAETDIIQLDSSAAKEVIFAQTLQAIEQRLDENIAK